MLKKTILTLTACIGACIAGCASDANTSPTSYESENVTGDGVLYLRGEMNDYAEAEAYRLRSYQGGKCALATLRSDWSPYKFKFADRSWSRGNNYGFATPPGVLRQGSAPVKLNPNSQFEELRYYVKKDGIYRFCIVDKSDGSYATVEPASEEDKSSLSSLLNFG